MMHYQKGENVEEELSKDHLPFDNLPKDFLWMHVKGGTKVHNVIEYAKKALDGGVQRTIVWSGYGGGVVKTISCAEILKRCYQLHQITRLTYKEIDEHWLPNTEGLEEIVVNRKIPCIHILLTLDEVDANTPGLQKAGIKTPFWVEQQEKAGGSRGNKNKQGRGANQRRNQNKSQKQTHKGGKEKSKQQQGAEKPS